MPHQQESNYIHYHQGKLHDRKEALPQISQPLPLLYRQLNQKTANGLDTRWSQLLYEAEQGVTAVLAPLADSFRPQAQQIDSQPEPDIKKMVGQSDYSCYRDL